MTITQQIRELQSLSPAQLAERYQELLGKGPRNRNKAFLQRQVAWAIQERAFGGLSDRARSRLDELVAQIDLPLGAPPPKPRPQLMRTEPRAPMVGTVLTRRWHDEEVRVAVVEGGYEWRGCVYRSLTAAVRAITNSNWNPNIFFGITKRGAAQ